MNSVHLHILGDWFPSSFGSRYTHSDELQVIWNVTVGVPVIFKINQAIPNLILIPTRYSLFIDIFHGIELAIAY